MDARDVHPTSSRNHREQPAGSTSPPLAPSVSASSRLTCEHTYENTNTPKNSTRTNALRGHFHSQVPFAAALMR
eukprot:scaffold2313_cov100-Isochrysis_galbana.AAC.2